MLKAGLIGCGAVSRGHALGLQAARGVELVALADVRELALRAAGETYGVSRLYADYREMIERERLDIVDICTQAPLHAQLTIAAAEMGVRGILCEKPLALTLADADAMIGACARGGARLAVYHQTRMISNTVRVERLIRDGAIGDLRTIRMTDKGGRPAGISLMELLTHVFDLVRLYAGDPAWAGAYLSVGESGPGQSDAPQREATVHDVARSRDVPPADRDCGLVLGDRCSAVFGFAPRQGWHSGVTASVESFWQPKVRGAKRELWHPSAELWGTEGVIFLCGTSDHVDAYLHRGPWVPPGTLERIDGPAEDITSLGFPQSGASPYHTAMVQELVAAMEEGREHRSSGADGRWTLEMVMGIYASHRLGGRRVNLPLASRTHPLEDWVAATGARQDERL